MKTQNQMILADLRRGYVLTSLDAIRRFGCVSFPKRICELKSKGHDVQARKFKTDTGKWINKYWLPKVNK